MAVLVLMAMHIVTSGAPARAAVPGDGIQFDDVSFKNQKFADGTRQQLTVKWSMDDDAAAPVDISMDFPEGLVGYADTFDLMNDGKSVGTCTVTRARISCKVDDDFINDHPRGVKGEFTFYVRTNVRNTTETKKTFTFGDIVDSVTLSPNSNWCRTEKCPFERQNKGKFGTYDNATDTIVWTVQVPADEQGIAEGTDISVTDNLDTDKYELVNDGTYPRVREGTSLSYNEWNREGVDYTTKPADQVTWNGDKTTASFKAVAGNGSGADLGDGKRGTDGSFYQVQWKVKVKTPGELINGGPNRSFTNSATYRIGSEDPADVNGTAVRYNGNGSVVGANYGQIKVTKQQDGDTTLKPEFTVKYHVQLVNGGTQDITKTLRNGDAFFTAEYFKGTVITFDEVKPTEPDNVTWADPQFVDSAGKPITGKPITISADNGTTGRLTNIKLVNRATLNKSTCKLTKKVENPDSIPDAKLNGLDYSVDYSYPADDEKGFEAGSGTLTVKADGTVESPRLPVGAKTTLSEPSLPTVAGATWDTPKWDPGATFTLGADDTPTIALTNTIHQDSGGFNVAKAVSGSGKNLVPQGTEFTVKYEYTAVNGFPAGSGEVTVKAGETSKDVTGIPAGAHVTLREVRPDDPIGGTWGEPKFDIADFTVVGDTTTAVSLDNPIEWNSGDFDVTKKVTGTAADKVGSDAAFTVDYDFTLPEGYPVADESDHTGNGTLTVLNDGKAVGGPQLPYDTKITLHEPKPSPVAGATWTGSHFDDATFTIGDKTTKSVTLTNELTKDVGRIQVGKTLTGTGKDMVGKDARFTLDYAYPAGEGFEAGSGSVTVKAGDTTAIDDLPAGARVTFTERKPGAVPGATWGEAAFPDGDTVTVEKSGSVKVAVVNPISRDATPTPTTTPTPTPTATVTPTDSPTASPSASPGDPGAGPTAGPGGGGGLPVTGAQIGGIGLVSALLLAAGIVIVGASARRHRKR